MQGMMGPTNARELVLRPGPEAKVGTWSGSLMQLSHRVKGTGLRNGCWRVPVRPGQRWPHFIVHGGGKGPTWYAHQVLYMLSQCEDLRTLPPEEFAGFCTTNMERYSILLLYALFYTLLMIIYRNKRLAKGGVACINPRHIERAHEGCWVEIEVPDKEEEVKEERKRKRKEKKKEKKVEDEEQECWVVIEVSDGEEEKKEKKKKKEKKVEDEEQECWVVIEVPDGDQL